MKLIHCADLHLDSKMRTNLSPEKAKERKNEILNTFSRMTDYAFNNGISAILISGDLFDSRVISSLSRNAVEKIIRCHPCITYYYLKGNHDTDNFIASILSGADEIPENLKLFNDEWTRYELEEGVFLYGAELVGDNSAGLQNSFAPNPSDVNIVMLHGQESFALSGDKAEVININLFKNKGIDYMALGHVHKYKCEQLDARGKYCYPGCLEGRGFDECGEHGFVVLDVDGKSGKITDTFVPFAFRNIYELKVDISEVSTTGEIIDLVRDAVDVSEATSKDMIKIVLVGGISVNCEKDIDYLYKVFEDEFYCLKISDETKTIINYEDYLLDESLKGEFVRTVMNADLSEEEKAEVIKYGLKAINGETIIDEN